MTHRPGCMPKIHHRRRGPAKGARRAGSFRQCRRYRQRNGALTAVSYGLGRHKRRNGRSTRLTRAHCEDGDKSASWTKSTTSTQSSYHLTDALPLCRDARSTTLGEHPEVDVVDRTNRKRYGMSTYYPSTSSSKKLSSLSSLSIILCSAGGSFSRSGSLFGSNGAEASFMFRGPSYLCSADVVEGAADGSLGCDDDAFASLSGFLFHHMFAGVKESRWESKA